MTDPCIVIRVGDEIRRPTAAEVEARASVLRQRLAGVATGAWSERRTRDGWIRELYRLGYEAEASRIWAAEHPDPEVA